MNLLIHNRLGDASAVARRQAGMTLVETSIATGLMVVIICGLLSANYVGLKQDQLVESKAGADDTSRRAINAMLSDIRLAKGYAIGNYATNAFVPCSTGTNLVTQQGTAVILYPVVNSTNQAVDTSQYILYYFDLSDLANNNGALWRIYNIQGTTTTTALVTSNLINTLYFTSEDFQGNPQSTRTYKGVIHTTLQFCEFQYPLTRVGSNCLYEYYRMDCRATPHLPDGP
jgi:type II secretory pathway pseudopilin PulG